MLELLILYLVSGFVLGALAVPLLYEKVRPNYIYGVRLPATLKDPEVWYATNRYAARWLLVTALVFMASAVGLYFVPGISVDGYALACLGVMVVVFTFGMVKTIRYMRHVARKSEP